MKIRRSGRAVFEYDGRMLGAEPHIKLCGRKHPFDVGRIYFAEDVDVDGKRFVVHAGVHDLGG